MYILCVYAIMAPAHESETIVFNFRKLLSTLPNYAELEQILLFSVNWGKQVCHPERRDYDEAKMGFKTGTGKT